MTSRSRCRAFVAAGSVSLLALLASSASAAAVGAASGSFESPNWRVPIVDAFAFRDEATFGEERVIRVAVSNYDFNDDFLVTIWDRRHMIDEFFIDEETRVVYFEFGLDGKYEGYSYYFQSGDGCGYCGGGAVASTVKLVGGRLKGSLKYADQEEGRSFDITLDAAVATDDYGKPIAAGGGEPGRAYLAYDAALASYDLAKIRPHLSADQLANAAKAEKADDVDGFLRYLTDNRPKKMSITRGFLQKEAALLLVTGESEILGKMHGEAHLKLEGGVWKVDDETLQMGAE